jgi:hypothetical protein
MQFGALVGAFVLAAVPGFALAGVCAPTNTGANSVGASLLLGDNGTGLYELDGSSCNQGFVDGRVGIGTGDGTLRVRNDAVLGFSGVLRVGELGLGLAELELGAQVTVAGRLEIGSTMPGTGGTVTIRDGATAQHAQTTVSLEDLLLGAGAPATLNIQDGAMVSATGTLIAGQDFPSAINVTNGATLTISSPPANHILGTRSTADLTVADATVVFEDRRGFLLLGTAPGGRGSITVSGSGLLQAGKIQTVAGDLFLGGGTLDADYQAFSGANEIEGTGTVTGDLSSHGVISPGDRLGAPIGSFDVGGIFVSASPGASVVAFEIQDATTFDSISVTGLAFIKGGVEIDFIDGFVPLGDSQFELMTAEDFFTYAPSSVTVTGVPQRLVDVDAVGLQSLIVTVPEPADAGLAALTTLAMLAQVARRRQHWRSNHSCDVRTDTVSGRVRSAVLRPRLQRDSPLRWAKYRAFARVDARWLVFS